MKFTLLATLFTLLNFTLNAQCTLKVKVENIDVSKKGALKIGLFDESGFLQDDKAIAGKYINITSNSMTIEFEQLKKGRYAIAVFHDEVQDKKLTKNSFGYPIEPYAFSRNAKGFMGPPSFEDAAIELKDKERLISIKL
jgi:uncharacterized protein (DUF2141 family)